MDSWEAYGKIRQDAESDVFSDVHKIASGRGFPAAGHCFEFLFRPLPEFGSLGGAFIRYHLFLPIAKMAIGG